MDRPLVGLHQDDEGHWVGTLGCAHRLHLRDTPPLVERPWIRTPAGRAKMIGQLIECVRCARMEWPEGVVAYQRTPTFDAVPGGLRAEHRTKAGVWGRIHVEVGALRYHVGDRIMQLTPDHPGIVVPQMPHHVEADGPVQFHVEFHRVEG